MTLLQRLAATLLLLLFSAPLPLTAAAVAASTVGPASVLDGSLLYGPQTVRRAKLCVYTIALNESNHVQPFMDAFKGADVILVADTGSTDGTIEALEALNATVHRVAIKPFRFDTARNIALSLLPADCDLALAFDMDDRPQPGWLEEVQAQWAKSGGTATAIKYRYIWRFKADGVTSSGEFPGFRIHSRFGHTWRHPAHEMIYWTGSGTPVDMWAGPALEVHHRPGARECRGKCRAPYLELLKLGAAEDPTSTRAAYYYGRDLIFDGQNEAGITELKRYLKLSSPAEEEPSSRVPSFRARERASAYRHISNGLVALNRLEDAQLAALRSVAEVGLDWAGSRDPWMALARASYLLKDWPTTNWAAAKALAVRKHTDSFEPEERNWGYEPHDLAALGLYYQGFYDQALQQGLKAVELAPDDERLKSNLDWYRRGVEQAKEDARFEDSHGGDSSPSESSNAQQPPAETVCEEHQDRTLQPES